MCSFGAILNSAHLLRALRRIGRTVNHYFSFLRSGQGLFKIPHLVNHAKGLRCRGENDLSAPEIRLYFLRR